MLALMEKKVTKHYAAQHGMDRKEIFTINQNVHEYSRKRDKIQDDLNLQINFLDKFSHDHAAYIKHEPKRMRHPVYE